MKVCCVVLRDQPDGFRTILVWNREHTTAFGHSRLRVDHTVLPSRHPVRLADGAQQRKDFLRRRIVGLTVFVRDTRGLEFPHGFIPPKANGPRQAVRAGSGSEKETRPGRSIWPRPKNLLCHITFHGTVQFHSPVLGYFDSDGSSGAGVPSEVRWEKVVTNEGAKPKGTK